MENEEPRIIQLQPLHVAATLGFGSGPNIYLSRCCSPGQMSGLLEDGQEHRSFERRFFG
jgi:hypothetical protein